MNISRTNIEAELRRHVAEGNLVSWVKGCQPGRRSDPMYTVTTVGGEVLRLATLFEIRALVVGLNSFELAQHRREMAEAVWIEQEAAAREERLAQQRELFALAIHTVECPSCASGVGERCTVKSPTRTRPTRTARGWNGQRRPGGGHDRGRAGRAGARRCLTCRPRARPGTASCMPGRAQVFVDTLHRCHIFSLTCMYVVS